MSRRGRGFTLIEMVVCLFLFSIFMVILTSLFSHTFRYTQFEEGPARFKQQARLALENVCNDIRRAQLVTRPANYWYLVWEDNDQIGLRFNPQWSHYYQLSNGRIVRTVTVSNGQVARTWTQNLCSGVNRFRLRVEDPRYPTLITVELEVQAGKTAATYRTKVNFRSVVQEKK